MGMTQFDVDNGGIYHIDRLSISTTYNTINNHLMLTHATQSVQSLSFT